MTQSTTFIWSYAPLISKDLYVALSNRIARVKTYHRPGKHMASFKWLLGANTPYVPGRCFSIHINPRCGHVISLLLITAYLPLGMALDENNDASKPSKAADVISLLSFVEWIAAILLVSLIAWLTTVKPPKDPTMTFCTLTGILALAIAAVFSDVRTTPILLYPVLALEFFFFLRYWQESFRVHSSMGRGCKFLIPGLGVLIDCIIVQLMSPSSNTNPGNSVNAAQGTFAQFLPFGMWMALSAVSYAASLLGRVRIMPGEEGLTSLGEQLPQWRTEQLDP
ncbi:MAG: hypothetical protein Q9227_003485 [Pyrenula ochraceoflavens]